ncbi:954_t:CDS:1, partial [Ambispora leptoticha]
TGIEVGPGKGFASLGKVEETMDTSILFLLILSLLIEETDDKSDFLLPLWLLVKSLRVNM